MDSSQENSSIHLAIWQVCELLRRSPTAPKVGHRLADLKCVFEALADSSDPEHEASEERAWSIWCDHVDPDAKSTMHKGIEMLATRNLESAQSLYDSLTQEYPNWAEAWNKRATVEYLRGYDCASLTDIGQTLALEPRHFGAMGGFAQICIRNGVLDGAKMGLQRMLSVHPFAPGIKESIASLSDSHRSVFH